MKLLRLKLENFRQHRSTEMTFEDGMTAIVGANGTGKTTILEAITFALYGVQRKTKDSLRFYWTEPRSKVRVTLDFEFENKRYVLERTNADASLVDHSLEPPVLKATGLREVRAACERLLRLTYDQFKNSFCAEQKNLAFLQFNTDTRRQEQVAKMLGFDRLKGAADLSREVGRRFRFLADELEKNLGNLDHLKQDLATAQKEIKLRQASAQEAIHARDGLSRRSPAVEEQKKLADEFIRLTQEANVFGGQAEALKSAKKRAEEALARAATDIEQRDKLKAPHEEFVQLDALVKELQTLREEQIEREKMLSEIQRLGTEVEALGLRVKGMPAPQVAELRKELDKCSGERLEAEKSLKNAEAAWSRSKQTCQAAFSTAEVEQKQAHLAFEKARKLVEQGVCPECGQPTSASFEDRLNALAADLVKCGKAYEEAKTALGESEHRPKIVIDADDRLSSAQKTLTEAQTKLNEAEKSQIEAKALQDELTAKEIRLKSLKSEASKHPSPYDRERHLTADAKRNELRASHEAFLRLGDVDSKLKHAQAELAIADKELSEAKTHYQALIQERSKLGLSDLAAATQAQTDFEMLRRQLAEAELSVKQAENALALAESALKQIEGRIEAHKQSEQQLKESRGQALLHETVEKEMKLLREELNSVIRPDLESRASENLALLTNGRYPVLELDEDFEPTILEDGIPKQVISGGEEDVVALALRLALSELIQERQGRPMSLMILDEVFGGLDADRRQAVLERLHAIKGRFSQILVISHIEEINQVADQCIFLTRDDESRSTIVGDLPLGSNDLVLR